MCCFSGGRLGGVVGVNVAYNWMTTCGLRVLWCLETREQRAENLGSSILDNRLILERSELEGIWAELVRIGFEAQPLHGNPAPALRLSN